MKKRGAKIKHTRHAAPTLVALHLAPEVSTSERMAVFALTQPWAATSHFNVLLDCQHMLTIAAAEKRDEEALKLAHFSDIALKSIRERHQRTGKMGATGDEIRALNLLADYSADWWSRQSGALFADAYRALDKLRDQQRVAA